MHRKIVDIVVVIPDPSPVLTLARIGRVDLLATFNVPIKIADQVYFEMTKPQSDLEGRVVAALKRLNRPIEIVETNVGAGYQIRRAKNPREPSGQLAEIAVDEYATKLAHETGPSLIPVVVFEDPDILELRIARLKNVHLLNTASWLMSLHREGLLEDALDLIVKINSTPITPAEPQKEARRTQKVSTISQSGGSVPLNEDLKGCSLADVLEKLEKGKIGHRAAMEWLNIESQNELVEIMHFNSRLMPGHRAMRVCAETRALVRAISRPVEAET